ncbi:MFS general substrate transporter [Myriangium duriaei CBS 260.36]|uniref:MFS general substrate transporter n=1 Tax=Myriangium duriaei CBS 260.36 TaxID=1168546 RepID=A0A9P4MQ73_9PEZI|nr:MFS general substrate transporter [Myriangium duriaei CBS 260.36]
MMDSVIRTEAKDEGSGDQLESNERTSSAAAVIDPRLDKTITRRFDTHVVPWLFFMYLLSHIDRSNIGNARIAGLAKDLELTGIRFNRMLTVYYVTFICACVPSNLIIKHIGAGHFLPFLTTSWGIVSLCTGFVTSYQELMAVRGLLGLCEGGLLPGVIVILSSFYPRHQLAHRLTLFYCAGPLSSAFGGLLAAGLSEITCGRYRGWPFIFFIEGAITVMYGLVIWWFLPHTPGEAKFLTGEEREAALARMRLDAQGSNAADSVQHERFDWRWVHRGVFNINTIASTLNLLGLVVPIFSFSLFLPTIISALGYTSLKAQLMTAPPNMVAFFAVPLAGRISDRLQMRGSLILVGEMVAIVGYVMLISTDHQLIQYGGTFLVGTGISVACPLLMTWLSNNLAPHYVRATGTGIQIMGSNFGAFIAVFTYLQKDEPRYLTGHAINIGMLCLTLICTVTMIVYCLWENKKRASGRRDYRLTNGDSQLLGYRHPSFRYTI